MRCSIISGGGGNSTKMCSNGRTIQTDEMMQGSETISNLFPARSKKQTNLSSGSQEDMSVSRYPGV
jgi:hypothetical protein